MRPAVALAGAATLLAGAQAAPVDYRADARALDALIATEYAYLDRFPSSIPPDSPELRARREAVRDRRSLLRYAEDRLASLADDHAITGASMADSWAVVASFADLWVERYGRGYRITAVRDGSAADAAGIETGDRLVAADNVPIERAVVAWWATLGLEPWGDRATHAARVIAAGRRDKPRRLTIEGARGRRTLMLPNLYAPKPQVAPVELVRGSSVATIRFHDSLGRTETIAAFDAAMHILPAGVPLVLDLTDTPSGGTTTIARAVMGWFADRATGYQVHERPGEERRTGIARRWVEQVLPRAGRRHRGPVTVHVSRWTGSMGEGLAIGMRALGAQVCGGPMAGLRGSIEDVRLPASGLVVKLPTERLLTVDGIAREAFVPPPCAGS